MNKAAKNRRPGRHPHRYISVRIPTSTLESLRERAKHSLRSINSEIVLRLENSLAPPAV